MAIVCGTDFSDDSARAELAAGHLAAKLGQELHLVHAVDVGSGERFDEPRRALATWAGRHLARSAERLRAIGCRVETHVEAGRPDDVLLELADKVDARLVVTAALSRRRGRGDELGSHSDRIARRGDVPVLVVRDPAPFEEWATGARPLRILLAVDLTVSSEGAIDWVAELTRAGRCEVIAANIYWPPGEYRRLGLKGPRSFVEPDPEVTRALERDLRARLEARLAAELASGEGGASSLTLRIEPNLGRVADRVIDLALEERADLIAVGAHRRSALARLWEGSVSRAVMRDGRLSVACVPAPREALARAAPAIRTVVAATDLSPLGDAAIGLAYSVVQTGGTVHVVHVRPAEPRGPSGSADALAETRGRLLALVPPDASARGVITEVHIVERKQPAEAICQAAERLAADLICVGTKGRTGLSSVLLGSVAGEVVAITHRSILLARPPKA
ncbi:MAG TPA: universal stress protein [Kofleriaceae bacterium]|nr:universal stress protein [Kofleriaceae bacterium]